MNQFNRLKKNFLFNFYYEDHVSFPLFLDEYFKNFDFNQRKLIVSCSHLKNMKSFNFFKSFHYIEINDINNKEQLKFALKFSENHKSIVCIDSMKLVKVIKTIDLKLFSNIKFLSIDRNKLIGFKNNHVLTNKLNGKDIEDLIIYFQNITKLIVKGNVNSESIIFSNRINDFHVETRFICNLNNDLYNKFFINALSYELQWLKYKDAFIKKLLKKDLNRVVYLQERYCSELNLINSKLPKKGDNFIFDLDGTLINSLSDISKCIYLTIEKHKLNIKDSPSNYIGMPIKKLFEICVENSDQKIIKKCVDSFREFYDNLSHDNTHEFPFTSDALNFLSKNNCKLYLVTNKPHFVTKKILTKLNLLQFFSKIYCLGDKGFKSKNTAVNNLIIQNNLVVSDTWIVGDTIEDIDAAKKNNLSSIYHQLGYGNVDLYVNKYPNIVIRSIRDLISLMSNK